MQRSLPQHCQWHATRRGFTVKPTLQVIYPPVSTRWDAVSFGHWLQSVGRRLVAAGVNVPLIPMVSGDESLFLGVETDAGTAAQIKRVLYS